MKYTEGTRLLDAKEQAATIAIHHRAGNNVAWVAFVAVLVLSAYATGLRRGEEAATVEVMAEESVRQASDVSGVRREVKVRPLVRAELSEQEARWAEECKAECAGAGFCCNDFQVGSNQYLSCAQGCMIRARGSSADECQVACLHHGCHLNVKGHDYRSCDQCHDKKPSCPYGVMSQKPCHYGCVARDWCWSVRQGTVTPGRLLGPEQTLEEAKATCLQKNCPAVICEGASCSARAGILQPGEAQAYVPALCASQTVWNTTEVNGPDLVEALIDR